MKIGKKRFNSRIISVIHFINGPIVASFISLITIPVITRFVSLEDFGRINLFLITQSFIYMFIYLAMDHAYVRFFNKSKRDEILTNILIFPILLSIFLIIAGSIWKEAISFAIFGEKNTFLLLCLLFTIPFGIIERFSQLTIRMLEKGFLYANLSIFSKLIILILVITFLIIFPQNYQTIAVVYLLSQIISALVSMYFCRDYWITLKISNLKKIEIKKYMAYALPMYPSTLMVWGLSSISIIMLRHLSTYDEVGLYSGATRITTIISLLQVAIMSFWVPLAYRWESEKRPFSHFEKASKIVILISSIGFVLVLMFNDYAYLFLGAQYKDVGLIIPLLLFVPFMNLNSEIVGIGINISNKTYLNTIISVIVLVFLLLTGYILINKYGALGAAISNAVSYIIFYFLKLLFSSRVWKRYDYKFYIINIILLLSCSCITFNYNNFYSILFNLVILIFFISILFAKAKPIVKTFRS